MRHQGIRPGISHTTNLDATILSEHSRVLNEIMLHPRSFRNHAPWPHGQDLKKNGTHILSACLFNLPASFSSRFYKSSRNQNLVFPCFSHAYGCFHRCRGACCHPAPTPDWPHHLEAPHPQRIILESRHGSFMSVLKHFWN